MGAKDRTLDAQLNGATAAMDRSFRRIECLTRAGALVRLATAVVLTVLSAGCEPSSTANSREPIAVTKGASVTTPQTPIDGNMLPKFVDSLPTFSGSRVDGTVTLNINIQEFQQKVLPAAFYAGLPAPYNDGTFLWGFNINGGGASWPARTIEARRGIATTAITPTACATRIFRTC
jgi:hypothetical protein